MNIRKWEQDEYVDATTIKMYLNNKYFMSNHKLFEAYVELFKLMQQYNEADIKSDDLKRLIATINMYNNKDVRTKDGNVVTKKICKSTESYFGSSHDTQRIKYIRHEIDKKLRLYSNSECTTKFNNNLYNIQKILTYGTTSVEKMDEIQSNMPYIAVNYDSIGNAIADTDKAIIVIADSTGNKYNTIVLVRHSYSFELYDIKNKKTVAYKNYKAQRTYGDWSLAIERMCQTAYNMFISRHSGYTIIHDINNLESDNKELKTVVQDPDKLQEHINNDLKQNNKELKAKNIIIQASEKLSKHGNIKDADDIKKMTAELLTVVDLDYLNKLLQDGNKEEIEKYLKKAYAKSFIRLVDRKVFDLNEKRYSKKLIGMHKKHKSMPRDIEYNEQKERGQLYCYGGIVIDGGNNKENQTVIELKLSDEAFVDFLKCTGNPNPDKSDWVRLVQEMIDAKSQSPNLFTINQHAIETYLINRYNKHSSILEDNKKKKQYANCVYIPCEYYEYIKEIFRHNETNKLLKRNYTAILNIIVYESLTELTGKDYMIK